MKATLLFYIFIIIEISNFAQSQRTVLLENYVQASCQPSAIYNQEIQNYLDTTTLSIAVINYHTPYPGADIMNEQNTEDVQERLDYYEVPGTPFSIIDGDYFQGGPIGSNFDGDEGWTSNSMQNRSKEEPLLLIEVSHDFNNDQSAVSIQVNITPLESLTGNYTLKTYIVEQMIEFDEPPGINGEVVFYHVMKENIQAGGSNQLPDNIIENQAINLNTSWQISNFYEKEMLSVIVFIQDEETKEVLNTGISEPKAIFQNDIEIERIIEPTKSYCNDPVYSSVSPVLKLRNRGAEKLDSLIVYTQINNELTDTSNFVLNLDFFESKELSIPSISYLSTPPDTVQFILELPNVATENVLENNSLSTVFDSVIDVIHPTLYLFLQPDNYGSEITWSVKKSNGTDIKAGGPYEDYNTELILDTIELGSEGCFYFEINDSYGDGINTDYGNGYYLLKNLFGDTIAFGNSYMHYEEKSFRSYKIPPKPTFTPNNEELSVELDQRISINFREPIRYINDSTIIDLDSLFSFKKDGPTGDTVDVNFRIWNGYFVYFDYELDYWTTYYLAFANGMEDYYDNPIPGQSITFRTRAEILGIEERNPETKFGIYPNPTSGDFQIKNIAQGLVQVFTMQGSKVYEKEISGNKQVFNIGLLPDGIYFVSIVDDATRSTSIISLIK